jgi:hypothetical protein
MTQAVPPEVLRKVRKLAQLPREARQSPFAVSVTRLTVLKGLCQQPEVANRFVTHLARKTLERVGRGKGRSPHRDKASDRGYRDMMAEALAGMEAWERGPTERLRRSLGDLLGRMRAEQDEHRAISWGSVRLITDADLLLFEYALSCLLHPPREAGHWSYQTARHYAERYDGRRGTGLTPASAPLVQDILDFWVRELGLDAEALTAPARARRRAGEKPPATGRGKGRARGRKEVRFTHRQGQFLAFIHLYWKLHRRGPAELDMVQYFRVTPPSVHGMVVKLEELGLITREPGVARSVRVAIPEEQIPELEDVPGGRGEGKAS